MARTGECKNVWKIAVEKLKRKRPLGNSRRRWKNDVKTYINPLKPNDPYGDRTAPRTSKRCILYIYSTNIGIEYFKNGIYSSFFPLSLFKIQFVS